MLVAAGKLELRLTRSRAGVDPTTLNARVDGAKRDVSFANGLARVSLNGAGRGRHTLIFGVADLQEVKNNENVAGILPNTRRFQASFLVP